eukprot:scaffold91710_cov41-Attheya_sp.AAC.1
MATLSECTQRWRKKRLLVLLSNNYANKKTIICQVEPSVSLVKTAAFRHRQLQTHFSRNDVSSK